MAKVEIGPLAARAGLIAAAIDRLTPRALRRERPALAIRAPSAQALPNEFSSVEARPDRYAIKPPE